MKAFKVKTFNSARELLVIAENYSSVLYKLENKKDSILEEDIEEISVINDYLPEQIVV